MHQFHILSFEGPDAYARAGNVASCITGLSQSLAESGFDTHLWFVGDPGKPGYETNHGLNLHRWCQWLCERHPSGVYDGEHDKATDYATSLPPYLMREHLLEHLRRGGTASVMAEEWHTVHAVLHLDWLLRKAGLRHRVQVVWNVNDTIGFDQIDWVHLARAATIATESRYMLHLMRSFGIDPLVIQNGIEQHAVNATDDAALIGQQPPTVEMARCGPDSRWLLAIDTVAVLHCTPNVA